MSIAAGTRLGPYEIVAQIGSGGMGEVFKARDTRLDRSVAIKVLPGAFAANAQLRVRFEREARTISQFSHPNICTLYDVGHDGGVSFLVMEYLQGETLAERLARGPLPVEQVVRYGVQICDALARAHRHGIIHRDLKPGNIMLTATGAKLLDFGLAKELETFSAAEMVTEVRPAAPATQRSITEEGTIVGTFQYMAPEQLEGGAVDARTDIFALGAVLYEMATGQRAFRGRTRASIIASILATEPEPVTAVQPAFPASLDRVIRTCLAKDPDERFQGAHDVKLALQWLAEPAQHAIQATAPRRSRAAWLTAAVLAVAFLAAAALLAREWMARRDAKPVRTTIAAPNGADFLFTSNGGPPELSPDGTKIVFAAGEPDRRTLWLRSLEGTAPQELPGTSGASFPFWSPDGRTVAFFQKGELRKMQVPSGPITTVCKVADGRGGSWSADGTTIVFAMRYSPIYRVAAAGGTPVAVTALSDGDVTHRWPRFLPDGRHFLFLTSPVAIEDPRNQICAGSIDEIMRKPLVTASSHPLFYDGRLLFTREGNLIAQRLDLDALALTGEPVSVPEGQIRTDSTFARSVVSVAGNGTLLYQSGSYIEETDLSWVDRTGKHLGAVADRQPYGQLALDSRGTTAVVALRGIQPNLWVVDLARGVRTRLTFNQRDQTPVWSADGRHLAYSSVKQAPQTELDLAVMDFATRRERQFRRPGDETPGSWSPDGRLLFYSGVADGTRTGRDIYYITLADGQSHVYLASPSDEAVPQMSPDGRFVAYQSLESGRWQIYIAPFPATGEKWQVSRDGGVVPRWRQDGKELFYVAGDTMTAIPIDLTGPPAIGTPQPLFRFSSSLPSPSGWDVTPDGQRFLIHGFANEEQKQQPLTLVQNFGTVLRMAERQEE